MVDFNFEMANTDLELTEEFELDFEFLVDITLFFDVSLLIFLFLFLFLLLLLLILILLLLLLFTEGGIGLLHTIRSISTSFIPATGSDISFNNSFNFTTVIDSRVAG